MIEMEKSITVVGGDLRIVKLIEMLDKDGYKVYTYGLENSEEVLNMERVELCPTLQEAVAASKVVVGPIPLSSDRKRLSMPFGRNSVELSEFVEAIQARQGYFVSCIEEIAWRRGFINDEQLRNIGNELNMTDYGKYILSLLEEK